MKFKKLQDLDKPSFCWDRNWNIAEIRTKLAQSEGHEHLALTAWILREGTFAEIWALLRPSEVYLILTALMPFLGRRKEYWNYTFNVWHALGKI